MPHSRVWWVSALRSTRSTGSSSWRRWRALASLSSSALLFGLMAVGSTGAGDSNGSIEMSAPRWARMSPVDVSFSLATAAMSPAGTSEAGSCSRPRRVSSWWRRSSATVRPLVSTASGCTLPDMTLNTLTRPT